MRLSPPRDVGLLLARQHHAVTDRQQRRVDAAVGADLGVQRADRIGIDVMVVRIGDAAGP